MAVPERLKEGHFREFSFIVARDGNQFIAVGYDSSGKEPV
jgi:hypothetical protein